MYIDVKPHMYFYWEIPSISSKVSGITEESYQPPCSSELRKMIQILMEFVVVRMTNKLSEFNPVNIKNNKKQNIKFNEIDLETLKVCSKVVRFMLFQLSGNSAYSKVIMRYCLWILENINKLKSFNDISDTFHNEALSTSEIINSDNHIQNINYKLTETYNKEVKRENRKKCNLDDHIILRNPDFQNQIIEAYVKEIVDIFHNYLTAWQKKMSIEFMDLVHQSSEEFSNAKEFENHVAQQILHIIDQSKNHCFEKDAEFNLKQFQYFIPKLYTGSQKKSFLIMLMETFNIKCLSSGLKQKCMQLISRVVQPKADAFRTIMKTNVLTERIQLSMYRWLLHKKRKFYEYWNRTDIFQVSYYHSDLKIKPNGSTSYTILNKLMGVISEWKTVLLNEIWYTKRSWNGGIKILKPDTLNCQAQEVFLSLKIYECLISFIIKQSACYTALSTWSEDVKLPHISKLLLKILKTIYDILIAMAHKHDKTKEALWKYKFFFIMQQNNNNPDFGELQLLSEIVKNRERLRESKDLTLFLNNLSTRLCPANFSVITKIYWVVSQVVTHEKFEDMLLLPFKKEVSSFAKLE